MRFSSFVKVRVEKGEGIDRQGAIERKREIIRHGDRQTIRHGDRQTNTERTD